MKDVTRLTAKLINAYFASHHGVITRHRASELGLSRHQIDWRVRAELWTPLRRGVYHRAGEPIGPEAQLLAACLALGRDTAASHRSAAWLWGLVASPPVVPQVTGALATRLRPRGAVLFRRGDLDTERILVHRAIPVTDPVRTLVDLGEVVSGSELDDAVDRALAMRLLTVLALEAEVARLGRRGRRGVPQLRSALERRGLVQGPSPSVLESRILRLLKRWGVVPLGVEVVLCEGRYRVDVLLQAGLALEVDGYAFHWSPEAKAADSHRRNQLALAGIRVIEADWVTIKREPERLRTTIRSAMDGHLVGGSQRNGQPAPTA